MDNKYKWQLVIATPLIVSLILVSLVNSAAPVTSQAEVPRDEIVWASGYWARPGSWVPAIAAWSAEAWGIYGFMYEPLFQYNYQTDELEGILGESIEWIDEYTIEVILRDGIHWNDGTPITPEDVKFSYYLCGGFDESPDGAYWQIPEFMAKVGPMSNFEVIDDRVFRVHIKEDYPNSRTVYYTLIGGSVLITPKHVWEEIESEYPGWLPAFPNDWADPDMPEEWKVASGPYLPYYWTNDREILIRNEDWWGIDVFGLPKPKYIGSLNFETNYGTNTALDDGTIDWYGGYYPRIWDIPNEYISTWTLMKSPYFLGGPSSLSLVPNYNRYPLNEPWLHRALAFAIDYEDLSITAASGYHTKSSPTLLCEFIPCLAKFIDDDIVDEYDFYFDPEEAVSILEEHCIEHEGAWYTKDAPATWRGEDIIDELPDVTGINVKLGPWKIMNVYGWTDTMMEAEIISISLHDILGIDVVSDPIEYSTFQSKFQAMDFDLEIQTDVGNPSVPWPHAFYTPAITGTPGEWRNYMGYGNWPSFTGSEVDNLIIELDSVPEGTSREAEIMNRLQEIFASELPAIPFAYAPVWYAFQTKYWSNWPTEENPYMRPTAPWDIGNPGAMQKLVCSLEPPVEAATLTVETTPVKGEVFVDGVSWGTAPKTRVVAPETYTVSFGDVENYSTPGDQTVTLAAEETKTVTGVYESVAPEEEEGIPMTYIAIGVVVIVLIALLAAKRV